jgi:hypothetical protein
VTPKRADATWRMAERRWSPLSSVPSRRGSSPPSPEFDRPPMRFMAMASVSCDSGEIEPRLMAPVAKRFTMSLAGSTSLRGKGDAASRKRSSPRSVARRPLSSLARRANSA